MFGLARERKLEPRQRIDDVLAPGNSQRGRVALVVAAMLRPSPRG
ncbi:hypothetical protein [Roseateles sp.]